jgi:homogentisate 1,2-dioxygenase
MLDGYVINIGVEFTVVCYKNYNKREVLANCLTLVQNYFDINNIQFCQPINLSRLELEIAKVDGVQSVSQLKVKNLTLKDGDYSPYEYDIAKATVDKVVYPSIDPSIFEVRFPAKDIVGRVA